MESLDSEHVHEQVDALLLSGSAATAHEAESMFLDAHLPELAQLALDLSPAEFELHEAVKLLMAHGSSRVLKNPESQSVFRFSRRPFIRTRGV